MQGFNSRGFMFMKTAAILVGDGSHNIIFLKSTGIDLLVAQLCRTIEVQWKRVDGKDFFETVIGKITFLAF